MFTLKSSRWWIAIAVAMIMALLPGASLAAGGDEIMVKESPTGVTADANDFTTVLDNLRAMGQAEARLAVVGSSRDTAVFDHSSDLARLHEQVMLVRNRPAIVSAADYTSHLEQLRHLAQKARLANKALATAQ